MEPSDHARLRRLLKRPAESHKYDFGHVLVVGGSPGLVGAPFLAARAALRSGAGLVTIAATASVVDKLERRVAEIMTLRLPDDSSGAIKVLTDFIKERKVSVLLVGPGLPMSRAPLVNTLLAKVRLPAVLDAGGFQPFNAKLPALRKVTDHNPNIILTPHTGEFARLIGEKLPADAAAVSELLLATSRATGATIVLKGHRSLVATPGGEQYANTTGNPGLATAGTGDVLGGIIAALLAQGCTAYEAAMFGVYLHGLAGDAAAHAKTQPSLIASDVIECLPEAFQQV